MKQISSIIHNEINFVKWIIYVVDGNAKWMYDENSFAFINHSTKSWCYQCQPLLNVCFHFHDYDSGGKRDEDGVCDKEKMDLMCVRLMLIWTEVKDCVCHKHSQPNQTNCKLNMLECSDMLCLCAKTLYFNSFISFVVISVCITTWTIQNIGYNRISW